MHKKLIKIFAIFLFLGNVALAQNARIDSLKNLLNASVMDTARVENTIDLAIEFMNIDKNQSIKYLDESFELSKSLGYLKGMMNSKRIAGLIFYNQSQYKESIQKFIDCVNLFEKYPAILQKNIKEKEQLGNIYNTLGVIFYYQATYEQSLDYYLKALNIFLETKNKVGEANAYNNMGIIYQNLNNLSRALSYHFKSLSIKNELNDQAGIATSYNNIGEIYRAEKKYEKALDYYFKSLRIKEKNGEESGISTSLNNIGMIYQVTGRKDSAYNYLKRAHDISLKYGDQFDIAESYVNIGEYFFSIGNYNSALSNFKKGYDISQKIGAPEIIKSASQKLSEISAKTGNFKDAYDFYIKFKETSDQLYNEENVKKITQLELQYDFDQKQKEREFELKQFELSQKNKLMTQRIISYAALIGLLLTLALAFVVFRNYNNKKRANKLLELQKEALSREKKKSDKLLLNVLPVEIADELKRNGKAQAKYHDLVSVIFTDFKGFTRMCELMDPIALITQLDTFFEIIDSIIEKNKIEKIKTVGDAYMCAGGLPKPNKSNPIDAILTGLEIQDYLYGVNEILKQEGKPLWELRVGIHTGNVVAGVIGKNKFAYDIWGDTVNVAARMEAACEPGKVNVSGDTYKFIMNYFDCTYRGKIEAKNKGEVDMYFVNRIKPEYSRDNKGVAPNSKLLDIIREMNRV